MSIEPSNPHQGTNPVAGIQPQNKKTLAADDASTDDGTGVFSALMSSMSDAASQTEQVADPATATGQPSAGKKKPPEEQADQAQLAIDHIVNMATSTVTSGLQQTIKPLADQATVALGGKGVSLIGAKVAKPVLAMTGAASDASDAGKTVLNTVAHSKGLPDASVATSLPGQESGAQTTPPVQMRWRDAAALLLAPVAGETGTKSGFVFADALGQLGRPQEHKSTLAQAGTGFEGMLGSALSDKLGISATYEVAAASAVVPDSQVAETVTHWVTHGVQNAELTLDGLGSEPVQVRISLHGDQAQIDFRSNQADVRLALEGAGAQLKSMLSSEGLQLAGMSVGTSGKGSQQHEQRQPQTGIRQTTVLSVDALAGTTPRVGNRSVGQALDLYV